MPLFTILTLFPEALAPYVRESIVGIAQEKGLLDVRLVDFRDFARDRHRTVDDRPYGGGPGMVLRPEPILECIEWLEARHGAFRKFLMTPDGRPFGQDLAHELAGELSSGDPECERVLLVCGRYEGFDERLREEVRFEDLSLGDFVLSGGELPALAVLEAVARLLPGVLGSDLSAEQDSFYEGGPLDCPHYTRPRVWRGRTVPEVLLSGDHERIARWRREEARKRTLERRPDLIHPPGSAPHRPAHPGPDNPRRDDEDEPRGSSEPCT